MASGTIRRGDQPLTPERQARDGGLYGVSRARSTIHLRARRWTSASRAWISLGTSCAVPGPNPAQTPWRKSTCTRHWIRVARYRPRSKAWCGRRSRAGICELRPRKCKGPLNDRTAATGKQLSGGGLSIHFRGRSSGRDRPWQRRSRLLRLGGSVQPWTRANVPIAEANGARRFSRLSTASVNIHIPYPMGFFSKNVDGRIDNPNTGWKDAECGPPPARARVPQRRGIESRPRYL